MQRSFRLLAVLLVIMQAGCDSKQANEVTGTPAERIAIVTKIISGNTPMSSELLDAHFVQDVTGAGEIGPPDVKSFGMLAVAPADLPAWKAILAPLEAHNAPTAYAAPKQACPWWLTAAEFAKLEMYSPKSLTGRVKGWIGVAPDGRIFTYTYSM